jgi:hypothetical protein
MDLLACPDAHACVWRDGVLYIEAVAASPTHSVIPAEAGTQDTPRHDQ